MWKIILGALLSFMAARFYDSSCSEGTFMAKINYTDIVCVYHTLRENAKYDFQTKDTNTL